MEDLLELAFACFVIYLLYKLVFNIVVPVSKAASQVKSKISEFNRMQQEEMRRQQQAAAPPPVAKPAPKKYSKDDDYIDFEEVK